MSEGLEKLESGHRNLRSAAAFSRPDGTFS